jgi:hypothetical protein
MRFTTILIILIPFLAKSQDKGAIYPLNNTEKRNTETLPEPMFFDLVRPLGAKKGEFEANSLVYFPLRRQSKNINWAPEIEFTIKDGLGIELEFPMQNNHLEAFKFAIQGTLNQSAKSNYIHGWQWLSEYLIEDKSKEFTLIYLGGLHLKNDFSLFFMSGPRYVYHFRPIEGIDQKTEIHALLNINVNKKISNYTTVSIEQNYGRHFNKGHEYRIIPQLHQRLSSRYILQFGLGYEWYLGSSFPALASRFIVEL